MPAQPIKIIESPAKDAGNSSSLNELEPARCNECLQRTLFVFCNGVDYRIACRTCGTIYCGSVFPLIIWVGHGAYLDCRSKLLNPTEEQIREKEYLVKRARENASKTIQSTADASPAEAEAEEEEENQRIP